jgi:Glycosyl transferase family 2
VTRVSSRRDRPYVSCIVTTFNYAHFVTQAIDSALAQTHGEDALEIIVVDGASTDDTPSVVERYLPRITYIREPRNDGVVSSANRGLEAASGDLIAFLNADDVWYPTTVERLAGRLAAKPDSGLVYGDMEMIDADGRSLHPSYYEQFGIRPESGRLLGRLLCGNFIASGCFMFRAELLSACHPIPDWVPWEDWYMTLRLAEVADFDYLPEPVLRYRFHGANQVLMAEGERLIATWGKELSFRRRLLVDIAPRAISAGDLVSAVAGFDAIARRLHEAAPDRLADALPVGNPERAEASVAAAAASRSEQDRDDEAALAHLARALALDPSDRDIRLRLAGVAARRLEDGARVAEEGRAALQAISQPGLEWSPRTNEVDPVDEAIQCLRELTARVSAAAPESVHKPRAGRHEALLAELPEDLAGRRVLDVPSRADDVPLALGERGAEQLTALEWEELDPDEVGRFDLIHADGLLDRELRPLPALEQMRELLADGARLYLGFTRTTAAERSEYVRLVESGPGGDVGALPGRTALSWMVEAAGLSPLREIGVEPSERSGIAVECGYLELAA